MEKKEFLYEGKAKKVWTTDDPSVYVVEYKNSLTAFNALKKDSIEGKGRLNNLISSAMFAGTSCQLSPNRSAHQPHASASGTALSRSQ